MKINLKKYSTNKYGLTNNQLIQLLKDNPQIDKKYFYDAMIGNTCIMDDDNNIINYFWDVETAIKCGVEKRSQTIGEFD